MRTVAEIFTHGFQTDLGWMQLQGTATGLSSLTYGELPVMRLADTPKRKLPGWALLTEERLTAYTRGEPVSFREIPLDIEHRSPFERRVREQVMLVGYGETLSYGELATAAGRPRAARAVGTVMKRNPIPLIIPCHRIVAAGGKLGGYSAAAGLSMKSQLLEMESQGRAQFGKSKGHTKATALGKSPRQARDVNR